MYLFASYLIVVLWIGNAKLSCAVRMDVSQLSGHCLMTDIQSVESLFYNGIMLFSSWLRNCLYCILCICNKCVIPIMSSTLSEFEKNYWDIWFENNVLSLFMCIAWLFSCANIFLTFIDVTRSTKNGYSFCSLNIKTCNDSSLKSLFGALSNVKVRQTVR